MSLPRLVVLAFALAALPDPSLAQAEKTAASVPTAELAERAARRFPQPVRIGDLPGRMLLGPSETQPVLGWVTAVVRGPDGGTRVVVRLAGWFSARSVAVPVDAVGLLGEHVALLDVKPEQLRALPPFEAAGTAEIPPDQTIRIGLVKPFH